MPDDVSIQFDRLSAGRIDARERRNRFRRKLVAIVLFGVSFAYVEAAVVVYLRAIYDPMRRAIHPDTAPDELFPLIRLDQLEAQGPEHVRHLLTELGREAATLVMLASLATAVARNAREWLAAFVIAFGVWDVFYYVFLKLLIDWPASLLTWDILFLLPVVWAGPVLAPVFVAMVMIALGAAVLDRECRGRPVAARWFHWVALVAGGLVVVISFCRDHRRLTAGEPPDTFAWHIFGVGVALGAATCVHALTRRATRDPHGNPRPPANCP